ncbi:MAG: DNA-processing protein DprA [Pirellulales bacterium]
MSLSTEPSADLAESASQSESAAQEAMLLDELRLCLAPGVGPRLRQLLLERFGSAREVLAAAPSDLREVPGIGTKISRAIVDARNESPAAALVDECRRNEIALLLSSADSYPRMLKEIVDPPGVLFVKGRLLPCDALSIAIVGSRHATHYGLTQAERLASGLARAGLTIISGLARGVDAAAHQGALAAGGRTIAVLGSGVLNIYPPEHQKLAADVIAHGALISEAAPHSEPFSGAFPQRNRIISGLSLGVIVVEASRQSGALITARLANEQGRQVFAVPGRVDNRMSQGCHRLIRDGAKLVESIDDVLEELGPLVEATPSATGQPIHHPAELSLNEIEQQILSAISAEPTSIDQVIAVSRLPPPQVLATLSVLEMRRLVRRLSGSMVVRM